LQNYVHFNLNSIFVAKFDVQTAVLKIQVFWL